MTCMGQGGSMSPLSTRVPYGRDRHVLFMLFRCTATRMPPCCPGDDMAGAHLGVLQPLGGEHATAVGGVQQAQRVEPEAARKQGQRQQEDGRSTGDAGVPGYLLSGEGAIQVGQRRLAGEGGEGHALLGSLALRQGTPSREEVSKFPLRPPRRRCGECPLACF